LLNDAQSSAIAGTEGAVTPFFSPDGRWLAFFTGPALKKVSFTGGAVATVAVLPVNAGAQEYRGATWADNGSIVFASSTGAGLFTVPAEGGEPKPLTTLAPNGAEMSHRWPHFLPGGKAILFTVKSASLESFDDAQIVVRSLETGAQHPVAQGGSAQYVPTGHLVYARAGALYAVRFDATRLVAIGAPVKVVDGVITHPNSGAAQFAIAQTGTLVYAAGDSTIAERPLMWVDRNGAARPVADRQASFWWPRISPDGRRIAVDIDAAYSKIWVVDVERGTMTRASQLAGNHERAEWMADGTHITFGADPAGSGKYRLFSDRVDGTGSATLLFDSDVSSTPLDWSPDGKWLLYRQTAAATGHDLWIYSPADGTSTPFLQTPADESLAVFSPDGRWIAYASDESGRTEVYVRPFPGRGTRTPISVDGGTAPLWSRDGRELFFARGDTLFVVPVTPGAAFKSGAARRLFSGPYGFDDVYLNYDIAPDGQHFVMPRSRVDAAPRQLELVLNWFDELNRLAPFD
ncbi:MAG TPA: hypothetical protein VFZ31_01485, partial [Vicinamibacterales bacterium]